MVDIDLGQSVKIHSEEISSLVRIIYQIYQSILDSIAQLSQSFLDMESLDKRKLFLEQLKEQSTRARGPIEIFTNTFEEVEFEGISLKSKYMFVQKLFATSIGLKKYIDKSNYLTQQSKNSFLRGLSHPRKVLKVYKDLKKMDLESVENSSTFNH